MPSRLAAPLLSVDANKMHKIDPSNAENLFGMWMVFSRCAESLEEGRRLENLSWRLWNRETFCCELHTPATTPSFDLQLQRPSTRDMPELSTSVESVASNEAERIERQVKPSSAPVDVKRPKPKQDLMESKSVMNPKHVTPSRLEKMIMHIQEKRKLAPLSPKLVPTVEGLPTITSFPHRMSDTSSRSGSIAQHGSADSFGPKSMVDSDTSFSSAELKSTDLHTSANVVRGFSPGRPSSYRSNSSLAPAPVPVRGTVASKVELPKKKAGIFMLGGSSGEDDESSFEEKISASGRSSLSEGLKKSLVDSRKHTSFAQTIKEAKYEDEGAIESDEEEEVSESAIEDDDDGSDWEDSVTESGQSSMDEKQLKFQRIDSVVNLRPNRRSLLTDMMHQPQRANAFANAAMRRSTSALQRSRVTTPNGPSVAGSPEESDAGLTMSRFTGTRSKPIIMAISNTHPPALSPRTTRRNMLATELTESLRKHLLWERQQKSTTANAVLKRRHTSHDVVNLQEFPAGQKQKQLSSPLNGSKNNSWNNYYFEYGVGEYHQKGW
ncbi:MAG: hypothetical protein M1834_002631 [Cirrosporium novae-zelandiae]|nr:MAG: hypothetical protein M1834_002631 [Cirrosporium novae-zelandiae]